MAMNKGNQLIWIRCCVLCVCVYVYVCVNVHNSVRFVCFLSAMCVIHGVCAYWLGSVQTHKIRSAKWRFFSHRVYYYIFFISTWGIYTDTTWMFSIVVSILLVFFSWRLKDLVCVIGPYLLSYNVNLACNIIWLGFHFRFHCAS